MYKARLPLIVGLSLLIGGSLGAGAQQTNSSATARASEDVPTCLHESGTVNRPSSETCSSVDNNSGNYSASATSGAISNFSGLAIGGTASVTLQPGGGSGDESTVEATAEVIDNLNVANIPTGSFLLVVMGLTATPSGSSFGLVTAQVSVQNTTTNSVTVDCPLISLQAPGANSCAAQTGVNPGDNIKLQAFVNGTATAYCFEPSCGAAAAGFVAGYKVPGGGKMLLARIVDGNGNPIVGATITTASGHKYPSKFGSTTTLASTANPSTFGQSVTFTATASSFGLSGTPTGKVTFKDTTTGTTLGRVTLSTGVATLTTSDLAIGTHGITATYGGDTWSLGSHSSTLNQVVN